MAATGEPELESYSTKEVAAILGVTTTAILNAVDDGRLTEWRRVGHGARAPYRFDKSSIDELGGELPGRRRRRSGPDAQASDLVALVALVERLQTELAGERTRRALADQLVVSLESDLERARGALRDVVERFTRPEIPDGPGIVGHQGR